MPIRGMKRTPSGIQHTFKKQQRIKSPKVPDRPLQLRSRDVVRRTEMIQDPWWWVLHRRGLKRGPDLTRFVLEGRAVPKSQVRGTLPERIVYKAFVTLLKFKPGFDFDFQSSLQGGRLELGGIVADFVFWTRKLVVQVQGPTHSGYLRSKKDEEQRLILEDMGFQVLFIDIDVVYDQYRFEDWIRRTFTLSLYGGSYHYIDSSEQVDSLDVMELMRIALSIDSKITSYGRVIGALHG